MRYLESESGYVSQADEARQLGKYLFSLRVEHMFPRLFNDTWLLAYLSCLSNSVCISFFYGYIYLTSQLFKSAVINSPGFYVNIGFVTY